MTVPWLTFRNSYVPHVSLSFGLVLTVGQVELKKKYKYRLILDESISFGSVGRTGRGLTELYNVPVRALDDYESV